MLVENSVFSCLEQLQKYQSDLMKSFIISVKLLRETVKQRLISLRF